MERHHDLVAMARDAAIAAKNKTVRRKRVTSPPPYAGIELDSIFEPSPSPVLAPVSAPVSAAAPAPPAKMVAEDGETLLPLSLDGTRVSGSRLSNDRSLRPTSDIVAFSRLEAELGRLERMAQGPATTDDVAMPPLLLLQSPSALLQQQQQQPALFAAGLEAAVPRLHASAADAIGEGVAAAVASKASGDTGPLESNFRLLLQQAAGATERDLLSPDHVQAAGRTYASLHPAARNLLKAMCDVRAKAADVATSFMAEEAGARLLSSVQTWQGAQWTTEDCYRRTRELQSRCAAWRQAVDANVQPLWAALSARIHDLVEAWNQVVTKYDAVVRVACGPSQPALDVGRFLSLSQLDSGTSKPSVAATLDSLRRAVAYFVDSWTARDTDVRAACLASASEAGVPSADQIAAAETALTSLQARLAAVEHSIAAARKHIVEAQKMQLAQLVLSGGAVSTDGMTLANALSSAAALQSSSDSHIEELYKERQQVKDALRAADDTLAQAKSHTRAQAAALVLRTHARWRDAALKAQTDVAGLEQEIALLRIFRSTQLQALEAEVAAEHGRILEAARAAYTACAGQASTTLEHALAALTAQRSAALAALEASEAVLGTELHSLMASVGSTTVPGIAVGMPQPAVKMVDDTMRTAVAERLGKVIVRVLVDHAAQLQPVSDGLAAGLSRPTPPTCV